MSKKIIVAIVLIFAVLGTGFFVWRVQNTRARAEKVESEILKGLTADEINIVLNNHSTTDSSGAAGITQSPEARQLFLKGMREYLALAAQARREGMTEDEDFEVNLAHKKNLLLADLYQAKLSADKGENYIVPKEELEAVWRDQQNEKQFTTDMDTLRRIQNSVARERGEKQAYEKLQGGALLKARENWARAKVISEKAKADTEFMKRKELELRLKILEAGILSADYLRKHWADKVRATDSEIAQYLAAHPEYDLAKKREKAELILQRAKAGEDFGKLAAEFSEDRSTKDKGGLYENVEKDSLWAEVETAALSLEKGQVATRLIETHTGFHIVKLENKQIKKEPNGKETINFSVRHILFQNGFEEPNGRPGVPPPFMNPVEIAKAEVEREKRNKMVEEIIGRGEIVLPEDFVM